MKPSPTKNDPRSKNGHAKIKIKRGNKLFGKKHHFIQIAEKGEDEDGKIIVQNRMERKSKLWNTPVKKIMHSDARNGN